QGHVTDAETGESIPGANILVKGTTTGVSTDQDGNFELEAPSLQDTLVVTFIGYQRKEVPINGRTDLNVELVPEAIMGEEMVVVGYGQQERRDITSSISSISSEDFENEPAHQIAQSLQGKISGVQIMENSGNPGSDFMMRIRGVGSVNDRSTQPLYVVDGNPMAEPADISPSQVES